MSAIRATCVVLCGVVFSIMANTGISLSGTVKDGDGGTIAGATVRLASDTTTHVTTGADGTFILGVAASIGSKGVSGHHLYKVGIKGRLLRFSLAASTENFVVSLFSANGKRHALFELGSFEQGTYTYMLPVLPPGFHVLCLAVDRMTMIRKLVVAGNKITIGAGETSMMREFRSTQTAMALSQEILDTLMVAKEGFKPLKEMIASRQQTGIAIIMDRTKSPTINVKEMPAINEMPDPMTMNDGTKVTTPEQWRLRRREMIRILEDYEYGHMPPPPGNVKAEVTTPLTRVTAGGKPADYRTVRLTFGPGEKCKFDLGIFTPVDTVKQYPVLIYLGYSNPGKSSLGDASAALSRGYAVAIINYSQLGADSPNWKTSAFFPSYPEYDWRDFSAWAWGISRAVDYLVTDSLIDPEKIMATGVSRCGQPVLLAGAFDERIALSVPVAGGMALRFSGKEMGGGLGQGITEVVDQGTYWFGPLFEKFRNQTPRLPCDQHWLPALTAPRLFIMCNSFKDEYGRAYAAVQTFLGALPVYTFLGVEENIGLNFRAGGHGMTSEDWSALLDFADQKLRKKEGTRKFNVIPPKEQTP